MDLDPSPFAAGRTAQRLRCFPEPVTRRRAAGGDRTRTAVLRTANSPATKLHGLLFFFLRWRAHPKRCAALHNGPSSNSPNTRPGVVFILHPATGEIQPESGTWPGVFVFNH